MAVFCFFSWQRLFFDNKQKVSGTKMLSVQQKKQVFNTKFVEKTEDIFLLICI